MNLIVPAIFKSVDQRVEAFFTESNRDSINIGGNIPGLNLGNNTEAEEAEIMNNFDRLFRKLKFDKRDDCLATALQVHGTHVQVVDEPGVYADTDGLITKTRGLALGVQVADCAAVLIADPENGIAGAFHAGWKGAARGIIPEGVKMMISQGAKTDCLRVYISPCISLGNFEVGEEVASMFPERFVDRRTYKKAHVDLKGFIMSKLLESGVRKDCIEMSLECTVEEERFYSYRREGKQAGRMLALVKLKS